MQTWLYYKCVIECWNNFQHTCNKVTWHLFLFMYSRCSSAKFRAINMIPNKCNVWHSLCFLRIASDMKRWKRIARNDPSPWVERIVFWHIFFPLDPPLFLCQSTTASDHEYEMRHLDTSSFRAWRQSGPLINFWEPALGRYVCTATPTPITDMETTFRSTDANQRPATMENHTPSCNARE